VRLNLFIAVDKEREREGDKDGERGKRAALICQLIKNEAV